MSEAKSDVRDEGAREGGRGVAEGAHATHSSDSLSPCLSALSAAALDGAVTVCVAVCRVGDSRSLWHSEARGRERRRGGGRVGEWEGVRERGRTVGVETHAQHTTGEERVRVWYERVVCVCECSRV